MFSKILKRLPYPVIKHAAPKDAQKYLMRYSTFNINSGNNKKTSDHCTASSEKKGTEKLFTDQVFYPLLRFNKFVHHPKMIDHKNNMIISSNLILTSMLYFNECPIPYSIFLITFFYASTEALFDSNQITRKVFLKPKNVAQFTAFNQVIFRNFVKKHLPFALIGKGHCMGHVMMWYQHHQMNVNYIKYLNELVTNLNKQIPLNTKQLQLLNNIAKYQKRVVEGGNIYPNNPDSLLNNSRQQHISKIIDKSSDNPNKLFGLLVGNNSTTHIIGVMAKNNQILYFDANFGEFIFNDTLLAKISLSRHLAYTYGNTLPELSRYSVSFHWRPTIHISSLFLEELTFEPLTLEEERQLPATLEMSATSHRNFLSFP